MSLQKLLWAAMVLCVTASVALADPMRTVFTKENKFPGAMKPELSLTGGGSSYKGENVDEDVSTYFIAPGARFGLTDRLTVLAEVPFVGYSAGEMDENGLGDISLGMEFLFFEDIFEYAWIIPHATAILPTGDEDKGLGKGEGQGRFGISIGTTVNDVLHFGADISYTMNGAQTVDEQGESEDLVAGALSIVWDLDNRSSLLGEVQMRNDSAELDSSNVVRGHLGLAYKVNKRLSLMAFGGSSSGNEDFYGMGRVVVSF
jgi:hypothetical protein